MVGRTPVAARQLVSRARRHVKGADMRIPDRDLTRQRTAVDAFFAAARGGDFDALVAVLDPDVVLRIDAGFTRRAASMVVHGAAAVASQTRMGLRSLLGRPSTRLYPALVNGAARVIVSIDGRPVNVMGFTVVDGRIIEIDAIADPERVGRIATAALGDQQSRGRSVDGRGRRAGLGAHLPIPGAPMTVGHDRPPSFAYGGPAMRRPPRAIEHIGSSALVRSPEPTTRQLAVLDAYAAAGSYQLAAATAGISPALVRNVLIEIREHYCAATTIQAYRAALAAGDLPTPRG